MANIKSINKSRISDNEDGVRWSIPEGGIDDTDSRFTVDVMNIYEELQELLFSKHKDYGPKNISHSPGGPLNGLRVRLHDKLARINHLIDKGAHNKPSHESLEDSFKDMANYAIIGLLVLQGKWNRK
jgi:hypothetical protein